MVTRNPGPWFAEALAGIDAQDYPNMSVLVIDAGSEVDPLPTVAQYLPSAYVRHLGANPGFSAAANEVLGRVAGAEFFAFCHDDVVLDPDALRLLVGEALRSDAGIVGPKLVGWGEAEHLLQVGVTIDKTGFVESPVERGELDQEQHDRVRDVFAIPGACTVVRADLFEALGGFDPAITFFGDDIDLCWRAQILGARVVVVPDARAQHMEASGLRADEATRRRLQARHRLRSVLTCYGLFHLLRVFPQLVVVSVAEVVVAGATGRLSQAGDVIGAWGWNLRRPMELHARRRQLRKKRKLSDGEVRRLQTRGSAVLNAFVRGELGGGDRVRTSLAEVGRGITGNLVGPRRFVVGAWLAVALLVLVGSRHLIGGSLPAVGSFAPVGESPLGLLHEYVTGWRHSGLGGDAPSPTAGGLLGLLGLVFLGAMGQLQKVLVLGALPAGLFGMWRLAAPLSARARAVGVVAYTAVPVPYVALQQGRWGTLAFFAAAPWMLRRLLATFGQAPFAPGPEPDLETGRSSPSETTPHDVHPHGVVRAAGPMAGSEPVERSLVAEADWRPIPSEETDHRSPLREAMALGLGVALIAALVPAVVLLVPLLALALVAGGALTGGGDGAGRLVKVALGASGIAVVLHLPWSFDVFVPGAGWHVLAGVDPVGLDGFSIFELLRFQSTPSRSEVLAWGLPLAAALPLLVGRGWRLAWAGRLWMVALACWMLVWLGGHEGFPVPLPSAGFLLVPASAAVALAVALAVSSVELDVRTRPLGAAQALSTVAAVALVVALLPTVGATFDGRWGMPTAGFGQSFQSLTADDPAVDDAYRVLWLGHPDVLPLGSHRIADGLSYGISGDGSPNLLELWPGRTDGGAALVGDAVRLALAGETQRLGRLLAPIGVRYVAMPERAAPERTGLPLRPLPPGLRRALGSQLDFRGLDVDAALLLYENAAWAPRRIQATEETAETIVGSNSLFGNAVALDLSGADAVLPRRTGRLRYEGEVEPGVVYVAEAASNSWRLLVNDREVPRSDALGWASTFEVADGGPATLLYRTSLVRRLAVLLQVALWAAVIAWCAGHARFLEELVTSLRDRGGETS